MAGIQRPNTHYADGEEDELQFHLELDDPPQPALTVATFDTYILNIHNDLELSRPAEGYGLDGPQVSSHGPKPSSPISLDFVWDHLDKVQPSADVMAAQAMEAVNRTFIELKSKNEETRLRASYDLRDLVVSAARGGAFCLPRSWCTG